MDKINKLILEMINFDGGNPELIQHFIKVHEFSKIIGSMENLSSYDMEVLEVASIVHDVGIKISMEKYGRNDGKLQEQEGPSYAEKMLKNLGFGDDVIDRVSYLVAHHHTYSDINEIDYQILVESDFLVNLYENQSNEETIKNTYDKIFKTLSGREILIKMFL